MNLLKSLCKQKAFQVGAVMALVWLFALADWLWIHMLPDSVLHLVFGSITGLVCWFVYKQSKSRHEDAIVFWSLFSFGIPVWWHAGVYFCEWLGLEVFRAYFARKPNL